MQPIKNQLENSHMEFLSGFISANTESKVTFTIHKNGQSYSHETYKLIVDIGDRTTNMLKEIYIRIDRGATEEYNISEIKSNLIVGSDITKQTYQLNGEELTIGITSTTGAKINIKLEDIGIK